jgi:hypothetical protein
MSTEQAVFVLPILKGGWNVQASLSTIHSDTPATTSPHQFPSADTHTESEINDKLEFCTLTPCLRLALYLLNLLVRCAEGNGTRVGVGMYESFGYKNFFGRYMGMFNKF